MDSNQGCSAASYAGGKQMRSVARGRYEGALSQIARGARAAASVLRDEGKDEQAWEFVMLASWAKGELEASIASKQPLKGQQALFRNAELDSD